MSSEERLASVIAGEKVEHAAAEQDALRRELKKAQAEVVETRAAIASGRGAELGGSAEQRRSLSVRRRSASSTCSSWACAD